MADKLKGKLEDLHAIVAEDEEGGMLCPAFCGYRSFIPVAVAGDLTSVIFVDSVA